MFFDLRKYIQKGYLYNFFIGARGCGKTFSIKKVTTEDFFKTGEQFVYIRRYDSEIADKKLQSFYDDLIREYPEYANHEFKIKDQTAFIDGEVAGYFKCISRGVVDKGLNAYTKVTKIFLDEFILSKSSYHYLPNEPEMFEDTVENIARLKDVPVFAFSNNVTQVNPYFLFYGIRFTPNSPRVFKNEDIYAENLDMTEYQTFKANTRRGRVLRETAYFDYAFNNTARYDSKTNIRKKPSGSRLLATFTINDVKMGVWKSPNYGEFTLSPDAKGCNVNYEFDIGKVGDAKMLLNYKSIIVRRVLDAFSAGTLYFENQQIKNTFLKIVRR